MHGCKGHNSRIIITHAHGESSVDGPETYLHMYMMVNVATIVGVFFVAHCYAAITFPTPFYAWGCKYIVVVW